MTGPMRASWSSRARSGIERTEMRSATSELSPRRRRSLMRRAAARVSVKVARRMRAAGSRRARWAARWRATTVLPVPAEPETRAGPVKARVDEVALRGVEEDGPGLPGRVEGGLELGARLHQVEAALGVGVGEGVGRGLGDGKGAGGGEGEERLGGFGGEVVHEGEEAVLVGGADVRRASREGRRRRGGWRRPRRRRGGAADGAGGARVAPPRRARGPRRSGRRRSSGGSRCGGGRPRRRRRRGGRRRRAGSRGRACGRRCGGRR